MTPGSTHGQRNRLVRRVMRHRSIATLFREPEAPAGTSLRFGQGPVVSESWDSRDALPAALFEGHAPSEITERRDPDENRELGPEKVAPAPARRTPAESKQETEDEVGGRNEVARRDEAAQRDEGALDEKVWQRLTSIFRRHQEKAEGAEAGERGERAAAADLGSTPLSNSTELSDSAWLSQAPQPQPSPQPERVDEQPSTLSEPDEVDNFHAEAAARPERDTVGAETAVRPQPAVGRQNILTEGRASPKEAHATIQRAPSAPVSLAAPAESGLQPEEAAEAGELAGQPKPAPTSTLEPQAPLRPSGAAPLPGREAPRLERPDADLAVAGPEDGLRPEVARSRDAETASGLPAHAEPRERLTGAPSPSLPPPLEAVWQVERRAEVATPDAGALPHSSPGTAETESGLGAGSRPVRHQPAAHIEPGDRRAMPPTRSSIEVLPPRGPRPQVAERRRADAAPPLGAAPEAVETEIGPLPADLWGLIGETAPASLPPALQASAAPDLSQRASTSLAPAVTDPRDIAAPSRETMEPHADPTVRAPSPPSAPKVGDEPASGRTPAPSQPVVPRAPEPRAATARPAAIQRVMRVDELETEVEPDPPNADAELREPEAREAGGGTLDLEELARRVYADVKRRLSVERERARGR
jgi:hypothetical protein